MPERAEQEQLNMAVHRARRRQKALERLREAAAGSPSAARLLALVDPDGTLRFTDENGNPAGPEKFTVTGG